MLRKNIKLICEQRLRGVLEAGLVANDVSHETMRRFDCEARLCFADIAFSRRL